ncbi:aspartate--tRNA ligase [Candidatus Peregrinibacteria bacterium]|nr:aspartate--tRNA ligase [Candidatus Peregrinibacteria bacterium]
MLRTHTCGELTEKHVKTETTLCGWVHRRRDHGGVIFVDLRDRYGLTQVVFHPDILKKNFSLAEELRPEYVIKVQGKVRMRPEGQTNEKIKTGKIEIEVTELEFLNRAKTPPFEIDQEMEVKEELRLKYRYLDIRRERVKNNLILRSEIFKTTRKFFENEGFLEIETPILIKGTPEGSREYLVPSRLYPGDFYVLPQSPQQLKQLLMVAGIDRYFQIPRCFRDEDQRGDRQPEFTQLDLEMSFVNQEDVMDVIERYFLEITEKHTTGKKFPKKFPRMTYHDAMSTYGVDKPDMRFDLKLVNISSEKEKCGFGVFENSEYVFVLPVPKKHGEVTRKMIDDYTELAKKNGAGGLAWFRVGEESGPVAKYCSKEFLEKITKKTNSEKGDLLLFGAGNFETAVSPLGAIRSSLGDVFNLKDPNNFAYLWVYEFPMFEMNSEGQIGAVHHPFTRPLKEDQHLLANEPLKARAEAYDIVLNGVELGGGSIRIHESELQAQIFDILRISKEDADRRFGHMLRAFEYGAPPHGGCAPGLDRIVMMFAGEPNIREVIAFPKNQTAQDLMLGAPSKMPEEQIKELHIEVREEE